MRLTSQTLLCDGVGSLKTSANLMRSSETRSRGNAASSAARFGSMGNSPKVERARCPPPPSPLSLGSLRIARQSPRDFRRSLPFQKALKTWIFPPELHQRHLHWPSSLSRRDPSRRTTGDHRPQDVAGSPGDVYYRHGSTL